MALFKIQKQEINENIVSLIRRRMLQVWVHSYIYYELNDSIVSDAKWSEWAKELVELIHNNPIEFHSVKNHEIFEGFTGDTGFDIAKKADIECISKAYYLLGKRKGE